MPDLTWDMVSVDMGEQNLSPGGTACPARHLYRLLPEALAARIAELSPYEHCGTQVRFLRAAGHAGTYAQYGAELVSWPPFPHESASRGKNGRTSYYSASIGVSLRTAPFSPVPRIHLHTGIRRWVHGRLYSVGTQRAAVYLLAESPLMTAGTANPSRFGVAALRWDRKTGKIGWAEGGPESMLARLCIIEQLPLPELLEKAPEDWLGGRGEVSAAVVHHTRMGSHPVKLGLMPGERRRLVEWAGEAFRPWFRPIDPLRHAPFPRAEQNPTKVLEERKTVPKKATEQERARLARSHEATDERNAAERRPRVAAALGERSLTAIVLYQT